MINLVVHIRNCNMLFELFSAFLDICSKLRFLNKTPYRNTIQNSFDPDKAGHTVGSDLA